MLLQILENQVIDGGVLSLLIQLNQTVKQVQCQVEVQEAQSVIFFPQRVVVYYLLQRNPFLASYFMKRLNYGSLHNFHMLLI